jgi:preprotein translocase subunit SecE
LSDKAKQVKKKENAIQRYFRETSGELRKVSWPTWPEARRLTGLVLLVMLIVGSLLSLVDFFAGEILRLILA